MKYAAEVASTSSTFDSTTRVGPQRAWAVKLTGGSGEQQAITEWEHVMRDGMRISFNLGGRVFLVGVGAHASEATPAAAEQALGNVALSQMLDLDGLTCRFVGLRFPALVGRYYTGNWVASADEETRTIHVADAPAGRSFVGWSPAVSVSNVTCVAGSPVEPEIGLLDRPTDAETELSRLFARFADRSFDRGEDSEFDTRLISYLRAGGRNWLLTLKGLLYEDRRISPDAAGRALLVVGSSADSGTRDDRLALLLPFLGHASAALRHDAALALSDLDDPRARGPLERARGTETDNVVAQVISAVLRSL